MGGGRKVRGLPSKVCLPWVRKRGIWDVPGIVLGCPRPLQHGGVQKVCAKKCMFILRSLKECNSEANGETEQIGVIRDSPGLRSADVGP